MAGETTKAGEPTASGSPSEKPVEPQGVDKARYEELQAKHAALERELQGARSGMGAAQREAADMRKELTELKVRTDIQTQSQAQTQSAASYQEMLDKLLSDGVSQEAAKQMLDLERKLTAKVAAVEQMQDRLSAVYRGMAEDAMNGKVESAIAASGMVVPKTLHRAVRQDLRNIALERNAKEGIPVETALAEEAMKMGAELSSLTKKASPAESGTGANEPVIPTGGQTPASKPPVRPKLPSPADRQAYLEGRYAEIQARRQTGPLGAT